jgi:hypothetical protein
VDAYTVAMPWYEREDFEELLALAVDREGAATNYDEWHSKATQVAKIYLNRGQALTLVTIRPKPFLEWLDARGLPNSAENRIRYVEHLTTTGGEGPEAS